jgi:hypothetical protein
MKLAVFGLVCVFVHLTCCVDVYGKNGFLNKISGGGGGGGGNGEWNKITGGGGSLSGGFQGASNAINRWNIDPTVHGSSTNKLLQQAVGNAVGNGKPFSTNPFHGGELGKWGTHPFNPFKVVSVPKVNLPNWNPQWASQPINFGSLAQQGSNAVNRWNIDPTVRGSTTNKAFRKAGSGISGAYHRTSDYFSTGHGGGRKSRRGGGGGDGPYYEDSPNPGYKQGGRDQAPGLKGGNAAGAEGSGDGGSPPDKEDDPASPPAEVVGAFLTGSNRPYRARSTDLVGIVHRSTSALRRTGQPAPRRSAPAQP